MGCLATQCGMQLWARGVHIFTTGAEAVGECSYSTIDLPWESLDISSEDKEKTHGIPFQFLWVRDFFIVLAILKYFCHIYSHVLVAE